MRCANKSVYFYWPISVAARDADDDDDIWEMLYLQLKITEYFELYYGVHVCVCLFACLGVP